MSRGNTNTGIRARPSSELVKPRENPVAVFAENGGVIGPDPIDPKHLFERGLILPRIHNPRIKAIACRLLEGLRVFKAGNRPSVYGLVKDARPIGLFPIHQPVGQRGKGSRERRCQQPDLVSFCGCAPDGICDIHRGEKCLSINPGSWRFRDQEHEQGTSGEESRGFVGSGAEDQNAGVVFLLPLQATLFSALTNILLCGVHRIHPRQPLTGEIPARGLKRSLDRFELTV